MDEQQWLTVAETASRLDRSTEQVRRYLREGELPGQRIGGQWFVSAEAVAHFTRASRRSSSFLDRLPSTRRADPLGATIGIGRAGGHLAEGKDAYRASARWRRS